MSVGFPRRVLSASGKTVQRLQGTFYLGKAIQESYLIIRRPRMVRPYTLREVSFEG